MTEQVNPIDDNEPNADGTAQGKDVAINNPGLDKVPADPAVSTVKNATAEGPTIEPANPNHDIDPYMNQSNANHGRHSYQPTESFDNAQKQKDAEGPGSLPAVNR